MIFRYSFVVQNYFMGFVEKLKNEQMGGSLLISGLL